MDCRHFIILIMQMEKIRAHRERDQADSSSSNSSQSRKIPKEKEDSSEYTIKFSIKYTTQIGENIYILGNIQELGNWKETKIKLKWSEGHIWKSKLTLPSKVKNFCFKFVCASDKHMRWEEGADRIFDRTKFDENSDTIKLDCVWEHFSIGFNIFYPLANQTEYMQIIGGVDGLGSWFKNGGSPVKMMLTEPKTISGIELLI